MITNDRWLRGPEFLWKEQTHWPQMGKIPVLKDDDPEVRKEAQVYLTTAPRNVLETLILHHSCWWKLKRCIAWLLRCKECLRERVRLNKNVSVTSDTQVEPKRKLGRLTVEELDMAQDEILRHVQRTTFQKS